MVRLIVACLTVLGGFGTLAHAEERQFWMGEILMPNAACPRLTFVVKLARAEKTEGWTGTLSMPRGCGITGAIDTPLVGVVVSDERLSFITSQTTGENTYDAARVAGEKVAKGRVRIGGAQAVEIRMWEVDEAEARNAAPRRPQVPVGALPYEMREVRVPAPGEGGGAGGELSGVLSMPPGAGPFGAVVLVSDAEAQDRDHTEGTHKPYVVLADRLTRAGYAVLRCDDRGVGESSGSETDLTLEAGAPDIRAQVAFLAQTPKIDAARIGVIGRGEGAQLAAMAAGDDKSGIAFVVLLAPGGRKGIDLACLREERQLQAVGEDPAYITERVGRLRQALELALAGGKERELDELLRADVRAYVTAVRGMGLALTPDQIAMWASSRAEVMNRPRFRSWLAADPAESLRKVRCPVLVLGAAMDLMMPAADEIPLVRAALEETGNKRVEVKVLAGTNHWMQPCATGFADEVDLIETTFSEEALAEIVGFAGSVAGAE